MTVQTLTTDEERPNTEVADVDVLIQTFNEEENLPHTLASLKGWVARVFIVDSGSTDRTVAIAEEFGATVVHHPWEGYAAQKNWALDHLPFNSNWILILDADEAVSPPLRREIEDVVDQPVDQVEQAGFYLNRVFIFMGRQIRHCGYFPSWNLRLFKRGKARYEDRMVHEHMIVNGATGYLRHLLLHEDRRGLEHFFAKHNRYSTLEALEILECPEPWPGLARLFSNRVARRRFFKTRIIHHLPMPWTWRLFYMYILRGGFLDGRAGWVLSNFISSYEFFIQAKYRELRRLKDTLNPMRQRLSEPEGEMMSEARMAARLSNPPPHPASPPWQSAAATALAESAASASSDGNGDTATADGVTVTPPAELADGRPPPRRRRATDIAEARLSSPWTLRQNIGRVLWMLTWALLFRPSFHNWYAYRRMLLRVFGARIGRDVRIRPTATIEIPWHLDLGDESIIGDYAILYSLGQITLGKRVVVSQYAHLCAGTHDYRSPDFPVVRPPITIGDGAWIAADAFVGPGVVIGDRTILGARASAFSDLPPNVIAAGNPAKKIKLRPPDYGT